MLFFMASAFSEGFETARMLVKANRWSATDCEEQTPENILGLMGDCISGGFIGLRPNLSTYLDLILYLIEHKLVDPNETNTNKLRTKTANWEQTILFDVILGLGNSQNAENRGVFDDVTKESKEFFKKLLSLGCSPYITRKKLETSARETLFDYMDIYKDRSIFQKVIPELKAMALQQPPILHLLAPEEILLHKKHLQKFYETIESTPWMHEAVTLEPQYVDSFILNTQAMLPLMDLRKEKFRDWNTTPFHVILGNEHLTANQQTILFSAMFSVLKSLEWKDIFEMMNRSVRSIGDLEGCYTIEELALKHKLPLVVAEILAFKKDVLQTVCCSWLGEKIVPTLTTLEAQETLIGTYELQREEEQARFRLEKKMEDFFAHSKAIEEMGRE